MADPIGIENSVSSLKVRNNPEKKKFSWQKAQFGKSFDISSIFAEHEWNNFAISIDYDITINIYAVCHKLTS